MSGPQAVSMLYSSVCSVGCSLKSQLLELAIRSGERFKHEAEAVCELLMEHNTIAVALESCDEDLIGLALDNRCVF